MHGKPLGSRLIQKQLGFPDRELVEEITENLYFQYFISLPGYQTDGEAPIDDSASEREPMTAIVSVADKRRINLVESVGFDAYDRHERWTLQISFSI